MHFSFNARFHLQALRQAQIHTHPDTHQIDVNRQGKHDQTFISCSHAFKDTNVHISSAL